MEVRGDVIPFLINFAHFNTGGKCSVISMRNNQNSLMIQVETTANLTLPNSWELVSLEEDGIDIVDAEFETVTHRLDASGKAHEFIRLSIGEL